MIITANLTTKKMTPAAKKAEEKKLADEVLALKNKFLNLPTPEGNSFFSNKLTEQKISAGDKQKLIQRMVKAKTKNERILEVKLEYYRTSNLFQKNDQDNIGENLNLENYLKECLGYEFNKQKQEILDLLKTAEEEIKQNKFTLIEYRIKEVKKLEKILENPAKLKEKMTNDFNEALSVIDSNADKMISPREFNEYQVKTYLKNLLIDVFSWEKDIAAKKRPVGSPLYKRLESEANEIIKAAEIQLKKEIEAQEAAAIMADDEEDEALKDFKAESKEPS
jgi:hypothetical protein